MHIAYCSPSWPPEGAANGIVTYVSAMRDFLLSAGHDVSVLAGGTLHRSDGSCLTVAEPADAAPAWQRIARRIDNGLGHHPLTARRLARQLRSARALAGVDLVEMEESFGWSLEAQRRAGVPVVTRLHGPHFMKPGQDRPGRSLDDRLRAHAEGRAIRGAQALTSPTSRVLAATRQRYGRVAEHAEVIPNPVRGSARTWRPDHCEPGLILFVGRFDALKGADTVLAAFAALAALRTDAHLVVVGPDAGIPDGSGGMRRFAEYVEAELCEAVRVRIAFTGLLAPDQIQALRARAAVAVVASRCETFGYAALEAMAIGTPVVSTDWDGSGEIIRDGVTGWRTPLGDAAALSERLDWVLDHPDDVAKVAAAGQNQCRSAYSIEVVGPQMERFYSAMLARSGRQ